MNQTEIGWVIATEESGGILALDFDDVDINRVRRLVMEIQERERLGNATLIESSLRHYHCYFFWNNLSWNRINEIIERSWGVDKKFKEFRKKVGLIRMRVTNIKGTPFIVGSKYHRNNKLGEFMYNTYNSMIWRRIG